MFNSRVLSNGIRLKKIRPLNMEPILTDVDYKKVINRIAALSENVTDLSNFAELNNLRQMAMDYERTKYDFTLRLNQDYTWSVAG